MSEFQELNTILQKSLVGFNDDEVNNFVEYLFNKNLTFIEQSLNEKLDQLKFRNLSELINQLMKYRKTSSNEQLNTKLDRNINNIINHTIKTLIEECRVNGSLNMHDFVAKLYEINGIDEYLFDKNGKFVELFSNQLYGGKKESIIDNLTIENIINIAEEYVRQNEINNDDKLKIIKQIYEIYKIKCKDKFIFKDFYYGFLSFKSAIYDFAKLMNNWIYNEIISQLDNKEKYFDVNNLTIENVILVVKDYIVSNKINDNDKLKIIEQIYKICKEKHRNEFNFIDFYDEFVDDDYSKLISKWAFDKIFNNLNIEERNLIINNLTIENIIEIAKNYIEQNDISVDNESKIVEKIYKIYGNKAEPGFINFYRKLGDNYYFRLGNNWAFDKIFNNQNNEEKKSIIDDLTIENIIEIAEKYIKQNKNNISINDKLRIFEQIYEIYKNKNGPNFINFYNEFSVNYNNELINDWVYNEIINKSNHTYETSIINELTIENIINIAKYYIKNNNKNNDEKLEIIKKTYKICKEKYRYGFNFMNFYNEFRGIDYHLGIGFVYNNDKLINNWAYDKIFNNSNIEERNLIINELPISYIIDIIKNYIKDNHKNDKEKLDIIKKMCEVCKNKPEFDLHNLLFESTLITNNSIMLSNNSIILPNDISPWLTGVTLPNNGVTLPIGWQNSILTVEIIRDNIINIVNNNINNAIMNNNNCFLYSATFKIGCLIENCKNIDDDKKLDIIEETYKICKEKYRYRFNFINFYNGLTPGDCLRLRNNWFYNKIINQSDNKDPIINELPIDFIIHITKYYIISNNIKDEKKQLNIVEQIHEICKLKQGFNEKEFINILKKYGISYEKLKTELKTQPETQSESSAEQPLQKTNNPKQRIEEVNNKKDKELNLNLTGANEGFIIKDFKFTSKK